MENESPHCHLCQEDTGSVCASCRLPVCLRDAITTLKHRLAICTRCEGNRIKTFYQSGMAANGTEPV